MPTEPEPLTAAALAGLLAEPRRLRALAAVVLGARTLPDVAQAAALSSRDAAAALHRLAATGLVVDGPAGWVCDEEQLRGTVTAGRSAAPEEPGGLRPFVAGDRLVSLPASRSRRRAVLEHVAGHALSAGEVYDERAVDERLERWCAGGTVDRVALRRYLVEEGLVTRGAGAYVLGPGPLPLSEGERRVAALGLA